MSKYTVLVGVNYAGTNRAVNHELNADSPHQCGSVISKLIEDEPDAINFQILVQREEDGKGDTKT